MKSLYPFINQFLQKGDELFARTPIKHIRFWQMYWIHLFLFFFPLSPYQYMWNVSTEMTFAFVVFIIILSYKVFQRIYQGKPGSLNILTWVYLFTLVTTPLSWFDGQSISIEVLLPKLKIVFIWTVLIFYFRHFWAGKYSKAHLVLGKKS